MKKFETESMKLKKAIDDDEGKNKLRIALKKCVDENSGMGEYLNYIFNRKSKLGIVLGILLSILGVELILIGILLGGIT